MRGSTAVALFLALLAGMTAAQDAPVVVRFGDPVLEARVRFLLDIPDGDILDTDLVGVGFTELNLTGFLISDLSGLEYGLDLVRLELSFNAIDDLSPLATLTELDVLLLDHNRIADLGPLAGLSNLAVLGLAANRIDDIGPLAQLTDLRRLDLSENAIQTIDALAGLPRLTEVSLENNAVIDVTPLASNERFGAGDYANLLGNPLGQDSLCGAIPELLERGVLLEFEGVCPGAIEGEVYDATTGLPIACALVLAQAPLANPGIGATDLDGVYYMSDLAAVTYTLQVFAPGYERSAGLGDVDPFTTRRIGFPLLPVVRDDVVSVTGSAEDSNLGLPLIGVEVTAFDGAVPIDTAYTCATGAFELLIPAGSPTSLTVEFTAPGYAGREVDLDLAAYGEIHVALIPRNSFPGTLSGTVTDAWTEEGLEGARVMLLPEGGILGVGTLTGPGGSYSIGNLPSGEYLLRVSSGLHPEEGETLRVAIAGGPATQDVAIGRPRPPIPLPPSCGSAPGRTAPPGDLLLLTSFALLLVGARRRQRLES